mgnify:CR=1 FL=1
MAKDASFQLLIDMCNKVGWDDGIKSLEKIVLQNENAQEYLYGGESRQIKQAQNLSKTIIQQNITIGRLKQYRKERGL